MSRIPVLFAALLVGAASLSSYAADNLPASSEAWVSQMLDGKRNGAAFKDPAAFAEWLDAVAEPRFMTALATAAVAPETYPKALSDTMDPDAARNWSEFSDPQLYLRWMLASVNPSFQQAIIRRMSDPAKMKRWVESASRPEMYASMATVFAQTPMAWMQASALPVSQPFITRAGQPQLPVAWFGAMVEGVGNHISGQEWLKLSADKLPNMPQVNAVRSRY